MQSVSGIIFNNNFQLRPEVLLFFKLASRILDAFAVVDLRGNVQLLSNKFSEDPLQYPVCTSTSRRRYLFHLRLINVLGFSALYFMQDIY